MKKTIQLLFILVLTGTPGLCSSKNDNPVTGQYQDKPFIQNYSIKYNTAGGNIKFGKVVSDRNGYIQIFSSNGLLRPRGGQFLFPGILVKDVQDRETSDKKIAGIGTY
ncbi:MAG TPA: hypothetical protein VFC67_07705, partial [Prolixibacteraceae bacterium]|nr:hypothetical protein [Prolixibacteraceae bacterium]